VFLAPRFDAYGDASRSVMAILREVTPLVEPLALDEAFLDVSGARRLLGSAPEIAIALRRRINAETGLVASVGVASTKFVAKLASDLAKPDGMLVVEAGTEIDFIHPLEVRRLWGVGPKTADRLAQLGVRTIGDLAALPEETLVHAIGDAHGRHLHALAWNRDERPVEPERAVKSIGHEETFPTDITDRETLEREVLRMAERVAERLRDARQAGRTVQLKLRYKDFRTITRSRTLPEVTNLAADIAAVVVRCSTPSTSATDPVARRRDAAAARGRRQGRRHRARPVAARHRRWRGGGDRRRRAVEDSMDAGGGASATTPSARRRCSTGARTSSRAWSRPVIRIGIIGCGHIGTVHSFALRQLGDAGLVAARVVGTFDADYRRAADLARHHDARAYEQLDDLLGDVDVVWVCTWTAAHREAVCAAGERSRAVFCEKPLAPTLAEAEQLAAVLASVPHQVGLVLRHAPVSVSRPTSSPTAGTGGRSPPCSATISTSRSRASTRRRGAPTPTKPAAGRCSSTRSTTSTCCAGCSAPRPASPRRSRRARRPCSSTPASTTRPPSRSVSTTSRRRRSSASGTRSSAAAPGAGWRCSARTPCSGRTTTTSDPFTSRPGTAKSWSSRRRRPGSIGSSSPRRSPPLAQYAEPSKVFLDALARDGARAHGYPDVGIAIAAHRLVDRAYQSAAAGGRPVRCDPSI
jgi:nucleotidyltransferase/DNA polymerase involved in DNA repair